MIASIILICVINAIYIDGHNTKDSFNIRMRDSAVHWIDELVNPDDYEVIHGGKDETEAIAHLLEELNKLAQEEYDKTLHTPYVEEFKDIFKINDTYIETESDRHITGHILCKRGAAAWDGDPEYDYAELLNDYIHAAADAHSCGDSTENEEEYQIGFKEVIFMIKNIIRHPPKITWDMLRIWFFVYLAIAGPLWCAKGWSCCCCCLGNRFFNPKRSIDEARKYYLQNPPGLLILPKVGVVCYKPTENEKESYARFGHALRTI